MTRQRQREHSDRRDERHPRHTPRRDPHRSLQPRTGIAIRACITTGVRIATGGCLTTPARIAIRAGIPAGVCVATGESITTGARTATRACAAICARRSGNRRNGTRTLSDISLHALGTVPIINLHRRRWCDAQDIPTPIMWRARSPDAGQVGQRLARQIA
ncbi:hypothetical protein ACEYYB_14190 [Paracoccus sp. p4-l81]